MSVEKAQQRILEIHAVIDNIQRISSVRSMPNGSVRVMGYDKHNNSNGAYSFKGKHADMFINVLVQIQQELRAELEPLEQLMGAADLMFKNAGGGNVAPSN